MLCGQFICSLRRWLFFRRAKRRSVSFALALEPDFCALGNCFALIVVRLVRPSCSRWLSVTWCTRSSFVLSVVSFPSRADRLGTRSQSALSLQQVLAPGLVHQLTQNTLEWVVGRLVTFLNCRMLTTMLRLKELARLRARYLGRRFQI